MTTQTPPAGQPAVTPPVEPPGRARPGWVRWVRRGLIAAGLVITLMCGVLMAAMVLDDRAINTAPRTATGTVLSVTALRTDIEFVDDKGNTVRPAGGVLYPGLLRVGQQFLVDYAGTDPQVARVAGRSARNGIASIVITVAACWLIGGGAGWLAGRAGAGGTGRGRGRRRPGGSPIATPAG